MSVVGYDIGNLNCVIAVTRKRGIDVIANEASRRTTACMAGFDGSTRNIGEPASVGLMRNLKNTITGVKRLLGRKFSDPDVQVELKSLPYKVVAGPGDSILLDVQYGEGRQQFAPEQIMAMILSKLQSTVAAETKQAAGACVISVPSYWGDAQLRAMRDSAAIAGVSCLRLISENTAAALHHGFYKQGLSDTEPVYFMVVDIGHASTSASIMALTKGKLSVVAAASDRFLGGRDFDRVLADHFAKEFLEKYKIDVRENGRASARLMESCEKLKKVLSANPKAPMNIECLMNDVDVASTMDRDMFLEMAAPLLDRIQTPILKCLEVAQQKLGEGFTADNLETVEVIGGSTRIPEVQARIAAAVGGHPLSHSLDKSETVSKGAALMCAILSPQFLVREFKVEDATPYAVRVSWGSVDAPDVVEDSALLFDRYNAVPSTKKITFQRTTAMFVEASYEDPSALLPGTPTVIGRWNVGPIPAPQVEGEVPKIKVKVKLDLHGVIKVESAIMTELEAIKVEEVEAAAEEDEKKDDEKKEDEKKDEPPKGAKGKLKHTQLLIAPNLTYRGTENVGLFTEKELQMAAQDRLIVETNEARNDVESYVYDMRGKLSGSLEKYATEECRSSFLSLLNQTEDWLYEEGEDAEKSVYVAKLKELRAFGDPIVNREKEANSRPQAVSALRAALEEFRGLAGTGDAKYEHIEAEERQKIVERCNEIEGWLTEQLGRQDATPLHADPVLLTSELTSKKDTLGYFARGIMNKPKPKPEPKKEAAPAPADTPKEGEAEPQTEGEGETPSAEAKGDDQGDMEVD